VSLRRLKPLSGVGRIGRLNPNWLPMGKTRSDQAGGDYDSGMRVNAPLRGAREGRTVRTQRHVLFPSQPAAAPVMAADAAVLVVLFTLDCSFSQDPTAEL